MSRPLPPTDVVPFFSLLYRSDKISQDDIRSLFSHLNVDEIKDATELTMQSYYIKEMGEPLKRCFVFINGKVKRKELVEFKYWAWERENEFSLDGKRVINIDPGYISLEQMVLSTFKPYSHRIFLGRDVYAELTYIYSEKCFSALPWTYPDYAEEEVRNLFKSKRKELLN